MSFFHVLISDSVEPDKFKCIAHDLSESELEASTVKPYRRGQALRANGRIYPSADLRGLKIIETDGVAEGVLSTATPALNRRYSTMNEDPRSGIFITRSRGYGLDDLCEVGRDVTAGFINSAPGEGSRFAPFVPPLMSNVGLLA